MSRHKKVELLPSIEEIQAIVRRKKQGLPEPGEEKRRMHEQWVAKIIKEEADAKERKSDDENYEDEIDS